MEIDAGWVSASLPKTGLDHLGVQAPCINVYGRLLPGITNVTDRVRYYSFYPWLFWAIDRLEDAPTPTALLEWFRRAECLFALIAERHARQSTGENDRTDNERHGIAMVGRDTLVPALDRLEEGAGSLQLSTYATQDEVKERYFQNKWGGLAQYYRGTLEDLGLLVGDSNVGGRYTQERGEPVAGAMAASIPGDFFLEKVRQDHITLEDLDSLSPFCPCQLERCPSEHQALEDILFDRLGIYSESGIQRRQSLCLLLDMSRQCASRGLDLDRESFVVSTYSGALADGSEWLCPDSLEEIRLGWSIYAANELLSLATQSIFFSVLESYEARYRAETGQLAETTGEVAAWYASTTESRSSLAPFGDRSIDEIVKDLRSSMPDLHAVDDPRHEIQLIKKRKSLVSSSGTSKDRTELLELSVLVILSLIARTEHAALPYGKLGIDSDYLADYPINLVSLHHHFEQDWKPLNARQLLDWIAHHWCLDTHFRIALRKLRYDIRSTFRVRPTDQGLEVAEKLPEPAETTPRFRQAMQILRDLDLLTRDADGASLPTESGERLLREFVDG